MATDAGQAAQPPSAADGALITPLAWLLGGNTVVLLVLLALQQALTAMPSLAVRLRPGLTGLRNAARAIARECGVATPGARASR